MHERPSSTPPDPEPSSSGAIPTRLRFGVFELDLELEQLTRSGRPVQLQPQPWKLLVLLVENPGALLSREEIQQHLWGDRIVDAEKGLNFAVRQIRRALGDDAANPVYVETVPRRGYRFVAPVAAARSPGPESPPPPAVLAPAPEPRAPGPRALRRGDNAVGTRRSLPGRNPWIFLVLALASLAAVAILWIGSREPAGSPLQEPQRLAVLPLEHRGEASSGELMALGLTEELLTELGNLDPQHIALLSLSASLPIAESPRPVEEIRRLLEADLVLRGSLETGEEPSRLQLRLERTEDRQLVWTDRFVETGGSALEAQRNLSVRAVRSLAAALEVPYRPEARPQEDPAARQAYLQGFYLLTKGGFDDALRSVPFFEQAVTNDPTSGRAHAGLAQALILSNSPTQGNEQRARTAALLALQLDPNLASPHLTLAWLAATYDRDLPEARRRVNRALELEPNFSEALQLLACFDLLDGHIEQGIRRAERAAALRPAAPASQADLAWHYFNSRRFEQAYEAAGTALELEPRNIIAFRIRLNSLLELGRWREASAFGRLLMQQWDADPSILERVEELPPEAALEAFWQWWWQGALRLQQQGFVSREGMVEAALRLGRQEQALELLEASAEDREAYLLSLPVDPRFDPLRSNPRFERLLQQAYPKESDQSPGGA